MAARSLARAEKETREIRLRNITATLAMLAVAHAPIPVARAATSSTPRAAVSYVDLWDYDATPARERAIDLWFGNRDRRPFTVDTRHVAIEITCAHFCPHGVSRRLAATDRGAVSSVETLGWAHAFVDVPVPNNLPWGIYRANTIDDGTVLRSSAGAATRVGSEGAMVSIPTAGWKFGEDAHLREIRNEYVGKTVQGFGPLEIACDDPHADAANRAREAAYRNFLRTKRFTSFVPPGAHLTERVGNEPSLRVVAVDRPMGPTRAWKIGGPVDSRRTGENWFVSVAPLKVTFATYRTGTQSCPNAHLWLADAWEVRRVLLIHTPAHVPDTTPIVRGMSKLVVAHIGGYPDTFGSVDDVRKLDYWHYPPILPPFDSSVRFRNGRVVEYTPPGEPP